LSSVILWGPPGIGKTSLAEVMATQSSAHFVRLSAVSSGVKDIRETIAQAQYLLGEKQRRTMVFIDEIHRFSTSQQDALLPAVESGLLVLVGATTENPFFEVNAPLRSRSTLFHLEPLSATHLSILIERGCAAENAHLDEVAKKHLLDMAQGDGRQILTR